MRKIAILLLLIAVACPLWASGSRESKTMGVTIPSTVNLTIGFGIGSFIQGDWKGGLAGLFGDVVAASLLGQAAWYSSISSYSVGNDRVITYADQKSADMLHKAFPYAIAGAGVLVVNRILETTVWPSLFEASRFPKTGQAGVIPAIADKLGEPDVV